MTRRDSDIYIEAHYCAIPIYVALLHQSCTVLDYIFTQLYKILQNYEISVLPLFLVFSTC